MKRVSIFGAAIVDILVSDADARVFQTGSSPTDGIRMSYGGDALNEATVLHKLGVPVRLQTVLGRDDAGKAVLQRLKALELDVRGVHIREDLRTSINVVLITPDGERSFLTDPHASMRQLRPEDLMIPEGTDILCLASIFVFPLLKTAELRDFFARAKAQGITVCADMTTCKTARRRRIWLRPLPTWTTSSPTKRRPCCSPANRPWRRLRTPCSAPVWAPWSSSAETGAAMCRQRAAASGVRRRQA